MIEDDNLIGLSNENIYQTMKTYLESIGVQHIKSLCK